MCTRPARHLETPYLSLIFSNVTHVQSSGVLDWFLSDHLPVYLIKKMNTRKTIKNITFMGRTYRNYSKEILEDIINRRIDVNKLLSLDDPCDCWKSLYDSLVSIAEEIVPQKEYRIKKEKPAWLTDELLNLRNDRDYFFKKAKKTGDEGDWFVARNLKKGECSNEIC